MDREALLRSLSFGAQVAEEETNELAEYFVETDQWLRIFGGEVDVIRGHKGAGKSAIYLLLAARDNLLFDKNILLVNAEKPRRKSELVMNSGVLLNESHEQNSKQITMTTHGYARVSTDGAQLAAKNEVKNQIRAQGLRLHEFTAKEITLRAEAWLEANPEMIAEARAKAAKFGWV